MTCFTFMTWYIFWYAIVVMRQARKEVTRQEHAERRRHFLEQQDKKNGFNVVSGAQIIPHQWKPSVGCVIPFQLVLFMISCKARR